MTDEFATWMLTFTFYAILGYVVEVALCSLRQKQFVGRGFLFGPVVPIYGFGAILVLLTAAPFSDNFLLTFLVSMVVCSALEYLTSLVMEKMFGIRWWDYTETEKYNLNGRICLRNSLAFGVSGCVIIYYIQDLVVALLDFLMPTLRIIFATIALIAFFIDTILSTYATKTATDYQDFGGVEGDKTTEIKRACRAIVKQIFTGVEETRKKRDKWIKKQQKLIEKERKKYEKALQKRFKKTRKVEKRSQKAKKKAAKKADRKSH